MRAVPKVSANYLDALERWDTGAIQTFVAQGLGSCWFWATSLLIASLVAAVGAPAFTEVTASDLPLVVMAPLDLRWRVDVVVIVASLTILFSTFGSFLVVSLCSPRLLNYALRFLVLLFNSLYPINAVCSLFWLALPPWLVYAARFPIALDATAAVSGGLILRALEFAIVSKMQKDSRAQGSELVEMSIFRSQQMDKVTVPIKLRAVFKGLSSGWKDVVRRHDNSFWESFGGGGAAQWVRIWLLLVCAAMVSCLVVGPAQLVACSLRGGSLSEVALPVGLGMAQAATTLWMLWDPLRFTLKGNVPQPSLRYVEAAMLIIVAFITILLIEF